MRMRRRTAVILATLAALGAVIVAIALGTTVTCNVAASGGYANCLVVSGPGYEQAKAPNGSATPYRFQLYRFSDGAKWGYWEWNDLDYHIVFLSLSGSITAQLDNFGSGTQGYSVTMSP